MPVVYIENRGLGKKFPRWPPSELTCLEGTLTVFTLFMEINLLN